MRCVAGHPQPVFNDILALDTFVSFDEIMILHHTDCGSTYWTDESVGSKVKEWFPAMETEEYVKGVNTWGATSKEDGPEVAVKKDLEWIRGTGLVRKELLARTRGFVYDVKNGSVIEVE